MNNSIIKTDVYMAWEVDFKTSINGVGGQVTETPNELITAALTTEDKEASWTAIRNRGSETVLPTGRTYKVTLTYKLSKNDPAGLYLYKKGLKDLGTDAMTDISLTTPAKIKLDGSATIKTTNTGTDKESDEVPEAVVELTYVGRPEFTDLNEEIENVEE